MDPTISAAIPAALLIAILVSLVKPFLERRIGPADPLHDPTVRLLAIGLGLGIGLGNYLLHTDHPNGPGAEGALGLGLTAGLGAIITYHAVSGSVFNGPPAPAQQQQPTAGSNTPSPSPLLPGPA